MPEPKRRWLRLGGGLILCAVCWIVISPRGTERADKADPVYDIAVHARPVEGAKLVSSGPFTLSGAWRLSSGSRFFNSLSGLDLLPNGRFLAASDRGWLIDMPQPGYGIAARITAWQYSYEYGIVDPGDSESVVVGNNGSTWIAAEQSNSIRRIMPDGHFDEVRPLAMRHWPTNRGPESMARLADGRFVVLGEAIEDGRDRTFSGLVFSGDPIESGKPFLFHLAMPGGLRPVGMALLPDGRLLVLGRRFGLPFRFASALYIVNPRDFEPAAKANARLLQWIDIPGLSDNFEGLAVEEGPEGDLTVWVVSDDNQATLIQGTYLLRLQTNAGAL